MGYKSVTFRLDEAVAKELKKLAYDNETSQQHY